MMRVETIAILEDKSILVLMCGHTVSTVAPNVAIGQPWQCPACERREGVQNASDTQLDAIAADYAETMRARGFVIGAPEEQAIRRAAAIQDAWRAAFARVMGSSNDTATKP